MKVKYNRLSSLSQTGNRLSDDKTEYDLVLSSLNLLPV